MSRMCLLTVCLFCSSLTGLFFWLYLFYLYHYRCRRLWGCGCIWSCTVTHTHTRTRTHMHACTHTHYVRIPLDEGLACCRGLYQHNTQQSQETNVCAPCRIQTCNPSSRAAADTCLRHLEFHLVIVPEVFLFSAFLVIDRGTTVRHSVQWSRFPAVCWECCWMVFWDVLDIILKFVVCGPTVNAFSYCRTLCYLKEAVWMMRTFVPNFFCVGID